MGNAIAFWTWRTSAKWHVEIWRWNSRKWWKNETNGKFEALRQTNNIVFFHMEPNLDYFATTKQHVPPSNDVKEKKNVTEECNRTYRTHKSHKCQSHFGKIQFICSVSHNGIMVLFLFFRSLSHTTPNCMHLCSIYHVSAAFFLIIHSYSHGSQKKNNHNHTTHNAIIINRK